MSEKRGVTSDDRARAYSHSPLLTKLRHLAALLLNEPFTGFTCDVVMVPKCGVLV